MMQTCCLQRQTRLMGILIFCISFLLIFQMWIVTCRSCLIYGREDNDFNVLVMLAGLIWNLMSKKVIKIKHSLTTMMSCHGNVFFSFFFFFALLAIYERGNHRSLIAWWRHQMETFSALLTICAGNSPVPVNFPHKGQWRGALMFALICVWINAWVNNRKAGDLRRYCAHYDIIVMFPLQRASNVQLWFHYLMSTWTSCWTNSPAASDLKFYGEHVTSL